MSDDDKVLKMPPPGERRIITPGDPRHPAFGPSSPQMARMPQPIQPKPDAHPITAAITYMPAPGLEDTAPSGIYWATEQGVIMSPALQEPIQLTGVPQGKGKKGEPQEEARPEKETSGSEP